MTSNLLIQAETRILCISMCERKGKGVDYQFSYLKLGLLLCSAKFLVVVPDWQHLVGRK
jgi:hypothetical protein